jgi:U32 family peptidase
MKRPELLLPVGNLEMCLAAIHNGADAIYVGMPGFNARGRTVDHSFEQLSEMIELCHQYQVKVNVAFNILIFEDEISSAISQLGKLLPLGPDAIIVQDLGLVKIIKTINPHQVVHASTQMTVTNDSAIKFTQDLDISRYVLGRENTLAEIENIKSLTDKELEVFVHGALCVAYSGQCFTSESIGGRSANRGQCAQSCRFEYSLLVDGVKKDLVETKYLVSPKDLCGINEVSKLKEIGVDSLKIEGRLKSPFYVASAASSYREALDNESADLQQLADDMAVNYSRGFYPGWLNGVEHQKLVGGTFGSNRGLEIGTVSEVGQNSVFIKTEHELLAGDGILIAGYENDSKKELGSNIYSVKKAYDELEISLLKGLDLKKVNAGDIVYLTSAPQKQKILQKSFNDKNFFKRLPLELKLIAIVGETSKLIGVLKGVEFSVCGADILESARGELDTLKIKKDLSALSATEFIASKVEFEFSETSPFLHNKALKQLRRALTDKIHDSLVNVGPIEINEFELPKEVISAGESSPKLRVLLREIDQVRWFSQIIKNDPKLINIIDSVILDFEYGKHYRTSLELLQENGIKVAIATNRILKPNEYFHLNNIIRLKPDYVLVRNLGAAEYFKSKAPELLLAGDFSLNVSNSITADYLFSKGLSSLTLSYELNEKQLIKLINNSKNKSFEVTVHQYMPSFHMEHCVYAAFLSNGSSAKDCGKPCEKHKVELHDQFGNKHLIKADSECRNTMFNASAITASKLIDQTKELGVSLYRLEMLYENELALKSKLENYYRLLSGEIDVNELQLNLGQSESYGLSSGQLFRVDDYEDRKKT